MTNRTDATPRPPVRRPAGFDFTAAMRKLCEAAVAGVPELAHIDLGRVAVSFAQARKLVPHGLQASLTPLRFAGGATSEKRGGRTYGVQRLLAPDGREILYLLNFYLPRFQQLDFHEKLVTIFHELWHISPEFNGDLRRHAGRCYAHSHSQAEYDRKMAALVNAWLQRNPPQELLAFLQLDFPTLQRRHGRVFGLKVPRPKLIRIDA